MDTNLIPGHWYPIVAGGALRRAPVALTRLGRPLVLWRDAAGRPVCATDRCPHRGAALSDGCVRAGTLQCPYHGLRFDAEGRCVLVPAHGAQRPVPASLDLERWPVIERHGFIWLWWGAEAERAAEPPWFEPLAHDAPNSWLLTFEWKVGLSRVMENLLDLYHFPFLHGRFSGGMGPLADPFEAVADGDTIRVRGDLRHESGSGTPRSLALEARFPNLVFLNLATHLRLLVAATPIDEQRTWIAARYSQDYVRLPGLGRLVAGVSALLERLFIWPADERVLGQTRPGTREQLLRPDRGIVLWRARRDRALGRERRPAAERISAAPVLQP